LQEHKWQNRWRSLLIIGPQTGAVSSIENTNLKVGPNYRGRSGGILIMKKIILVTLSIMVASLLCLAACAEAPTETVVEVTCDEFKERATIDKEVEVALDGLLIVSLCSDPDQYFEWDSRIIGPTIIGEVDLVYKPAEGDLVGADVMDVRTFKAAQKGETTLVLEQIRTTAPEEKGPWKLNLSVTVR
jgi:hypothetical protein